MSYLKLFNTNKLASPSGDPFTADMYRDLCSLLRLSDIRFLAAGLGATQVGFYEFLGDALESTERLFIWVQLPERFDTLDSLSNCAIAGVVTKALRCSVVLCGPERPPDSFLSLCGLAGPDVLYIDPDASMCDFYRLACHVGNALRVEEVQQILGLSNGDLLSDYGRVIGYVSSLFAAAHPIVPDDARALVIGGSEALSFVQLARSICVDLGRKPCAIGTLEIPAITGLDRSCLGAPDAQRILLSAGFKAIQKKINRNAFSGGGATLEDHERDGGNLLVDVPFYILALLWAHAPVKRAELYQLRIKYSSGQLKTGELKSIVCLACKNFLDLGFLPSASPYDLKKLCVADRSAVIEACDAFREGIATGTQLELALLYHYGYLPTCYPGTGPHTDIVLRGLADAMIGKDIELASLSYSERCQFANERVSRILAAPIHHIVALESKIHLTVADRGCYGI